jgi:hypothetical protein
MRIGQCVSDLTLHLQLHGLQQSEGGMQQLYRAAAGLSSPSAATTLDFAPSDSDCFIDRNALIINFDFSGKRKLLCSIDDGEFFCGQYDSNAVCVFEASSDAVLSLLQQQQLGTAPSLPRLLRDLTNAVHPNLVEVKGGFVEACDPACPHQQPKITLVCETFDQLLSSALEGEWSSSDKLSASTSICKGLSYLQSISRRCILVPDRIAVNRTPSSGLTCKLLPAVACTSRLCRWSPPEHALAAWDGLTSPAAVIFSFGLLLARMWGGSVITRRGPFPMADEQQIRSSTCAVPLWLTSS